jgi:hypothetical protein
MKNNIKYREDITGHIMELYRLPPSYRNGVKAFEIKGELYMYEENGFYSPYALYVGPESESLKKEIEDKFSVKFAKEGEDLICKCGESEKFSASDGRYEVLLKCNSCGPKFSAYSG